MRNKKGMLLAEETLKIVIAVIAISFLIFFLASLYFGNLKEKKQMSAAATLNQFKKVLDASDSVGIVRGIAPEGWYVFSFTKESEFSACSGKSCVCICENKWPLPIPFTPSENEKQASECRGEGKCLDVANLKSFKEIEIKDVQEGVTNIKINKTKEGVLIEEVE